MTVEVHHRVEGAEDAPALAFVNSLGASLEMWDPQAAALGSSHRVVRYDQRGHGGSPVAEGPYSVEALGTDLLALLDRLAIERASLCGISLGGAVCMWVATEAPDRVDRLALCCTRPSFPPAEQWRERAATVRAGGTAAIVESVLERWVTPEAAVDRPGLRERLGEMLRSTPAEGYAAACEALADADLRGRLAAIAAPTVAVAGAADPVCPVDEVAAFAARIPEARVEVIDRARHLANAERPENFNRVLARHLNGAPR